MSVPLTRIAAQAAKQVIYQKVKEAEREIVWREYGDRIGEMLTGQVKRFDRGDMILDLGRTEGIIPRREQSRAEHYNGSCLGAGREHGQEVFRALLARHARRQD